MSGAAFEFWFGIILPFTLFFLIGKIGEVRHFRSIRSREEQYLSLPLITHDMLSAMPKTHTGMQLVNGNCVISVDRFRQWLSQLKMFFGGNVTAFESALDRARREAILRMKEKAIDKAGQFHVTPVGIYNMRVETSRLSKNMAEACVYGTVVYRLTIIP